MEDRYVALIGSRDLCEESRLIRQHGLRILFINSTIFFNELCLVDRAIAADLNDVNDICSRVASLMSDVKIEAVLTQNEYRTELAASIAAMTGTCFLSKEVAALCRNKLRVRDSLKGTPQGTVAYVVNDNIRKLLNDTTALSFPVVAKPENDAGSNHVYVCQNTEELWDAVTTINNLATNHVKQMMKGRTLIEEYIEGREFSVESISDTDTCCIIAITEKFTCGSIEKAHLIPARITMEEKRTIVQFVSELHARLGITHAVTHTEIKLHEGAVRLIEINGRAGGDNIADLVRLTTSLDLFEAGLLLSQGKTVEDVLDELRYDPDNTCTAMSIFMFASNDGYVRYRTCPYSVNRNYPEGAYIRKTTSNYNRPASYIIFSETPFDPLTRITESDEYLTIECCQ
ncbi:ATP-grasp domain-containing protein [Cronobacter sakazakii]|nr:ATP-grasp domain-containing protein [Cronobacter sakazakii]